MTLPRALSDMGAAALDTQHTGFDGMLFTEAWRTPFPAITAGTLAAPDLEFSTGVAVAFARSPMVTAQVAWELQELTGGRFRLGLGTQVRTHVVRRYGMEFERPGPRLRLVSLGSAAATVVWVVGSLLFTVYVDHFSSYGQTYGALAAVVVVMLWLYLTAYIVLLGAEVNVEAERRVDEADSSG